MTFRNEQPRISKEKVSSKEHSNNRPRNHHAPDPPQPSTSGGCGEGCGTGLGNGNITPKAANNDLNLFHDPIELCIVDLKALNYREGLISYSPSSSGYSSLRHSADTLTYGILNKEASHVFTHSTQYPYFGASILSSSNGTKYPTQSSDGISVNVSNNLPNGLTNNMWACSCGTNSAANVNSSKRGSSEVKKLHVPSTICEESESSQRSRSSEIKPGSASLVN